LDFHQYRWRAYWPRISHSSVDRQPNDRLGRICRRPRLFKHGREILRAIWRAKSDPNCNNNSDCHTKGYGYRYSNSHTYCERNANSNAYTERDSNANGYVYADCDTSRYCDRDFYTYGDTYVHTESYSHTEATADSAAATVGLHM
jgi:hypothetical protein